MPSNAWAVGREAHAEWFVPTASGYLSEIQVAIEPDAGNKHPRKATIFITTDNGGFPGSTVESFDIPGGEVFELLTIKSFKEPILQAGAKYWLGARSQGGWHWNMNDQKVVHNTAREAKRGKWLSAGDYCTTGAFSIRITTNPPPAPTPDPAGDVRAESNKE